MNHKLYSNLIGKAGVGLACFHLARRGHDFTVTTSNSAQGDLWVDFGGKLEHVEVKASMQRTWNIRADQLGRVARIIFVDIDDGECWICPASEAMAYLASKNRATFTVGIAQIKSWEHVAWHTEMCRLLPSPARAKGAKAIPGGRNRRVKKTLANGEVKVYEYGPRAKSRKPLAVVA